PGRASNRPLVNCPTRSGRIRKLSSYTAIKTLVRRNAELGARNMDRLISVDCAGMVDGGTLARPAKRRRALLGSNPPRNSRPETHGDAGRRRRAMLAGVAVHDVGWAS